MLGGALQSVAGQASDSDWLDFRPIAELADRNGWNPGAPWIIPDGYRQYRVSGETDLNVYDRGRDDWVDMNTVNETGPQAGRFLYRTHELRYPDNQALGGAVSVVDLETGSARLLASDPGWNAVDGIRWTPWGSLLFGEEIEGGRLFEIYLRENRFEVERIEERPWAGRLAHEGIDLDAQGNVYLVDEHRGLSDGCGSLVPCGGGVYRFVPERYADLSNGRLYALKVNGSDGTGQGEWVGPIDPFDARRSGVAAGAQSYQRPEDLEIIDGVLYVAITEGSPDATGRERYAGRVLAVDLHSLRVTDFIMPGVNVAAESGRPGRPGYQSGFAKVDNLAQTPDGQLVAIEDNSPSDIWIASTRTDRQGASRSVRLFASLTDPKAEGTGIYISPTDPDTLYVNVQHSAARDGDATWAITRQVPGGERRGP